MRVAAGVVITLAVMSGLFFLSVFACCGFLGSVATPTSPRVASSELPSRDPSSQTSSEPAPNETKTSPSSTPKPEPPTRSEPDAELRSIMAWIRAGRPEITRLKVGAIGSIGGLEIIQIVDDRTALCMFRDSFQSVLVKGFNMTGHVDGERAKFNLVMVTGTTQYQSVLGAQKTVFVLERITRLDEAETELAQVEAREYAQDMLREAREKEEQERIAAEMQREAAAIAAEEREAQFRTWQSANGKFTIDARLVRYSNGTVVLEKRSGEEIDVDQKQLSDDDQTFIQEEMKRRLRGR